MSNGSAVYQLENISLTKGHVRLTRFVPQLISCSPAGEYFTGKRSRVIDQVSSLANQLFASLKIFHRQKTTGAIDQVSSSADQLFTSWRLFYWQNTTCDWSGEFLNWSAVYQLENISLAKDHVQLIRWVPQLFSCLPAGEYFNGKRPRAIDQVSSSAQQLFSSKMINSHAQLGQRVKYQVSS